MRLYCISVEYLKHILIVTQICGSDLLKDDLKINLME